MRISSSKGFTLLEIMIVISIVGILSAALFPAYNSYIERWRDSARLSAMDMISKALNLFYSEREDYPASDSNGCVDSSAIANFIEASKLNDPLSGHSNGCLTDGLYAYGMSTGIITASPDEFALIATMEQAFGGNYTGSIDWFTGILTSIAYTSGTTLTDKWAGPIYIRIP